MKEGGRARQPHNGAVGAAFRFLRQPSRPNAPMPVAMSGREAELLELLSRT